MSDNNNNTNASQGQPAPAPASDTPSQVNTTPDDAAAAAAAVLGGAAAAAGALGGIYRVIVRVNSFVAAEQEDMNVVHQEIQEILQAVNTPFDGLAANVQEDLRHALRTASVLAGVRRFAPALGITERPGLDDSVTVQRGLIPGWDTPVQSERPPFSQADWDRVEAHVRRRDRARQWRRYNRWIGEDSIAEEEHAEEIAELNARQWRRRNQSDQDSIAEEEHAEDVAELTEMYLGQQVQITRAGRSQLRQLGYPVRSNGILRVRRLDDDE
ncbi:hypothetical protein KC343_g1073 [Hortaea werneckii]|uniref:Uncharacterized protein n=1 Tax=Hortaea werneckii TaxID=91943 RepID=A0A3M7FR94_HORWE|nr:hypothetical protein KC323_g6684 [Hortaea werneckii]KAI7250177.1 hypothetical protein KC352_g12911 [Hortaea werneckii]KAI7348511.1 hypothetical protein KC320_g6600 [Hortaea werneckii]KAI7571998.1 hypothetical protein KC317_g1147 [Hortaea werneckii]KAI7627671.1 hypothetical protein KC346_g631 [Hortaea werneckii]